MHDLSLYTPAHSSITLALNALLPFLIIAAIWTLVLKGFALWYAARGSQKWWFIALLLINTLGILEIIYLLWFRPKSEAPVAAPTPSPASESSDSARA